MTTSSLIVLVVRVRIPIVTQKLFEAKRISNSEYDERNQQDCDHIGHALRDIVSDFAEEHGLTIEITN